MGIASFLKSILGTGRSRENYRCVKCGAAYERQYRECPDCGRRFVVPIDGRSGE